MYGPIESFSLRTYLDDTYPTDDDSEKIQELTDYISTSLSKNDNVTKTACERFLDSSLYIIKAISTLCVGVKNMDESPVQVIDDLCKAFDESLKNVFTQENNLQIADTNYFINLNAIPDALRFYKHLIDNNCIKYSMSRRHLEGIYNEACLQSKYSHALFILSWLDVLRVYNNNSVYFNYKCSIYI